VKRQPCAFALSAALQAYLAVPGGPLPFSSAVRECGRAGPAARARRMPLRIPPARWKDGNDIAAADCTPFTSAPCLRYSLPGAARAAACCTAGERPAGGSFPQ